MRIVGRALLALAGTAVVLLGLWCALWVVLVAGEAGHLPDPRAPDGDPCCAYPDTWSDVVGWGVLATAGAFVVGVILAAGAVLARAGVRRTAPSWRWLLAPPACSAVTVSGMAIGVAVEALG